MKTRFGDKCPKKKLTFSGVEALVTSWGSNPSTTVSTASVVKPSNYGDDYGSDMEEIVGITNKARNMHGSNPDFGYAGVMVATCTTRITEENLP